jgi:hypothetical protein
MLIAQVPYARLVALVKCARLAVFLMAKKTGQVLPCPANQFFDSWIQEL